MQLTPLDSGQITAEQITDIPGLDTISVFWQDIAPGQGRMIIECYGRAWSSFWGAMSGKTVRQFVLESSDADYIASCLMHGSRQTKSDHLYLLRIVSAVLSAHS